jgi:hypothetical protein
MYSYISVVSFFIRLFVWLIYYIVLYYIFGSNVTDKYTHIFNVQCNTPSVRGFVKLNNSDRQCRKRYRIRTYPALFICRWVDEITWEEESRHVWWRKTSSVCYNKCLRWKLKSKLLNMNQNVGLNDKITSVRYFPNLSLIGSEICLEKIVNVLMV